MKRIVYGILMLGATTALTSCDEAAEVVDMVFSDGKMEITSISPAKGYAGQPIAVYGKHLGASADLLKVTVGESVCTVNSCDDEAMEFVLPNGAKTGKLSLQLGDEKLATDSVITVITPKLTVPKTKVYASTNFSVNAENLEDKATNLKVTVGGLATTISGYTSAKGKQSFSVAVPKEVLVGNTELSVTLYGQEVLKQSLTVGAAPSVAVSDELYVEGDQLNITGSGWEDFDIQHTSLLFVNSEAVGDTITVKPDSMNNTQITAQIPNGFKPGGYVAVKFGDVPPVKAGVPKVLVDNEDVTSSVLKNSVAPFTPVGEWQKLGNSTPQAANPEGWIVEGFGNDACTPDILIMQCGWDYKKAKENAKLYQTVTLPRGKYTFHLDVKECGKSSGRFGAWFVASEKNIPDLIEKSRNWELTDVTGVLNSYRITDNKNKHTKDVVVTLTQTTTLNVGFVCQINGKGWVKLSSVKVTYNK